jgi:hypothetical protein
VNQNLSERVGTHVLLIITTTNDYQDGRTESAHFHVVSGVSSCYAVKPSALQKSDEPMWQSRKNLSLDGPYPSITFDMVDVVAYLVVQPWVKLFTTRQSLRAPPDSRQYAPTAADAVVNSDTADSTL